MRCFLILKHRVHKGHDIFKAIQPNGLSDPTEHQLLYGAEWAKLTLPGTDATQDVSSLGKWSLQSVELPKHGFWRWGQWLTQPQGLHGPLVCNPRGLPELSQSSCSDLLLKAACLHFPKLKPNQTKTAGAFHICPHFIHFQSSDNSHRKGIKSICLMMITQSQIPDALISLEKQTIP